MVMAMATATAECQLDNSHGFLPSLSLSLIHQRQKIYIYNILNFLDICELSILTNKKNRIIIQLYLILFYMTIL